MTPEEAAVLAYSRFMCLSGVHDNKVTRRREFYVDGQITFARTREECSRVKGNTDWGDYPDHPFNTKAES